MTRGAGSSKSREMQEILSGDRLSLSRLLTQIENDTSSGRSTLNDLFSFTGRAHLIGVTGAPGTGKSTLVNRLALHYRNPPNGDSKTVAIVAVDPSSPFSGGAVLGDRVRMRDLSGDKGVFIRSMASRGSLGGIALTTSGIVQAFDAAGFEIILIETVGAGQAEVEIARLAHTTIVVEAPGLGDDIQAIKAGILEIADILVINKADRPGAENTERALRSMLNLGHSISNSLIHHTNFPKSAPVENSGVSDIFWVPEVLRTIALHGSGIEELASAVETHYNYLKQTGEWQTRVRLRLKTELENQLQQSLVTRWRKALKIEIYNDVLDQLIKRNISPFEAANILINNNGYVK